MRPRKKILFIVVITLGVAILIPIVHHYQLRAAVNAYVAQLNAKGEPMTLAQVIPPSVPPEQNGAGTLKKAVALFNLEHDFLRTNYVYGMKMIAPGKALVRWQQPDIREEDETDSWQDVQSSVSQNQDAFRLLRQITNTPAFDFEMKYEKGVEDIDFGKVFLPESKRAAQRLETATLCDLRRSDTSSAVENLRAMLALVRAMRTERFVISELVRMAIAHLALNANWEILQSPDLTDAQLAALQRDWTSLEFIHSAEDALIMERMIGLITAEKWRNSNSKLFHDVSKSSEIMGYEASSFAKCRLGIEVFRWRYWWSYPDELRMLQGYQILLGATRFAETNYSLGTALAEQTNKLQRLNLDMPPSEILWLSPLDKVDLHSIMSSSARSLSVFFERVMAAEAAKQLTITAIVLKRYQLRYGNYPTNLSALAPEFVSEVPRDPVDGQALRYKLNPDGTFVLYSIGENGKDDGGNPNPMNEGSQSYYWQHGLDWVWPQPATKAEIQEYYSHQNSEN